MKFSSETKSRAVAVSLGKIQEFKIYGNQNWHKFTFKVLIDVDGLYLDVNYTLPEKSSILFRHYLTVFRDVRVSNGGKNFNRYEFGGILC